MNTLATYLQVGKLNAKNECTIYFIVTAGKRYWFNTGLKTLEKYWDKKSQSILKKHPQYYVVNPKLKQLESRAMQYISNGNIDNVNFIADNFYSFVFKGETKSNNIFFSSLINEYCKLENLGLGRIKHYTYLNTDIIAFNGEVVIQNVTYTYAKEFCNYLRKKGNNENTIIRKMRQVKAIVHFAQRKQLITTDPLAMLKLKEIVGNKEHLTANELTTLEQLYQSQYLEQNKKEVLRCFLFSCYTGLRYSDIFKLTHKNIKDNCVVLTQQKTKKILSVPLIQDAKKLIQIDANGKCFYVFTNQAVNRCLKEIAKDAQINKTLTYHCSRHTFATLSIYWGISKDVVADLMGIDFKTVNIYAKIVDDVKQREMLKWAKKA